MASREHFDITVIGSGIGGLTIGSLLSKNKKVLVLEKNGAFGGYCSQFKRKGFTFESSIQAINGLYGGNPSYEILKAAGALDGVTITQPKELYRAVFPGHVIKVPQKDIDEYRRSLSSIFPKEHEGIKKLFGTMKSIHGEMKRLYLERALKKSPFILKYCRKSFKDLLDEFIDDEKLKAIISQYWMYRGLPPGRISAITFAYIWFDYTADGSYMPKRGMAELIGNLVNTIRRNGGEVLANKEVSELVGAGDRIERLGLKNGHTIEDGVFISNIDVFRTFEMMKGHDHNRITPFLNKLKANSLSISAFKIYLGLAKDMRELGVSDYEIFVNTSYDIEAMYKACERNDFKNIPYSITIYSNLSDGFCEKGNSVISVGFLSTYGYWKKLSRDEYKKRKKEVVDIILERCEHIIPGFKKYIKVKAAATPVTMERYTGNSEGSIYGWNRKRLIEEIRFMNPTTPVKNLMLASQWTKMGGGIGGVLLAADRVYNILK